MTFQNLGFETPDTPPGKPTGWTITIVATAEAWYDFSGGYGNPLARETFDFETIPFISFGTFMEPANPVYLDWTVDVPSSTFTAPDHGLPNGWLVSFAAPPGGVTAFTDYYLVNVTRDTFQLSATLGGPHVTITGAPTSGTLAYLTHPLTNGMPVEVTAIAPGSGLTANTIYYVVNATQKSWGFALTQGGSPVTSFTNGSVSFKLSFRTSLMRSLTYTVDEATSTFTAVDHGLVLDDAVVTQGNLPAGLGNAGETLYVVNATKDTFQLAATSGGSAITIGGPPLAGTLLRVDADVVIFNAGTSFTRESENFESGWGDNEAFLWALAKAASVLFNSYFPFTADPSTSLFTVDGTTGFDPAGSQAVKLLGPGLPSTTPALVSGTTYYTRDVTVDPDGAFTTFRISTTPGGAAITVNLAGGAQARVFLGTGRVVEDFETGWGNDATILVLAGHEAAVTFGSGHPVEDYEEGWGNDTYKTSLGPGDVSGFTVGAPPGSSPDTESFAYTLGTFSFSVDPSTSLFTVPTTVFLPAQPIQFAGPGLPSTSPAPLTEGVTYWTRDVTIGSSSTTFQVSLTNGGPAITVNAGATVGTGATVFGDPGAYWNELVV